MRPPSRCTLGWGLALAALLLASTGCAGNKRLAEFQQVASLGGEYTQALDDALIRSGRLAIQANSLEMLANREAVAISLEELETQDDALRSLLAELALLRQQVLGLADYFNSLGALAGSKAPSRFAAGLNQSANALGSISGTLDSRLGSGRFAAVGAQAAAGAAVGEIAIRRKRARALQNELDQRHQIVAHTLELQEALLQTLIEMVEARQGYVAEASYDAKVATPFVSVDPLACPPLWLGDREAALLAGPLSDHLDLVVLANHELRSVWRKLLDDELGLLDLPLLAKALDDALAGPVGLPASPPPSAWHCPQVLTVPDP